MPGLKEPGSWPQVRVWLSCGSTRTGGRMAPVRDYQLRALWQAQDTCGGSSLGERRLDSSHAVALPEEVCQARWAGLVLQELPEGGAAPHS